MNTQDMEGTSRVEYRGGGTCAVHRNAACSGVQLRS